MNSPNGKRRAVAAKNQPTVPDGTWRIAQPLALAVMLILSAAILANSMTKELGRDEQMYCTAGVLLSQGQSIYRDFSYPSQLPYHPLLLAILYRGLGTTHYLLVGRLVSVASNILVLILIVLIFRSVFRDRRGEGLLLGLAAAVLYLFNPFVDYAAGYAWNHDVVTLCVVGALWLLLTTDFQAPSRYWRTAFLGILLTVATCMRVTTALVELTFLAALFWMAGGALSNRVRTALPFLAGATVAAIWPLWVIARSPQAFWLNLVRIPTLYGRWLHEIGMTFDKTALTIHAVLTPGYLILLVLVCGLAWVGCHYRLHLAPQERQRAIVAALLPVLFLVIAYIPPTMWLQYLAIPVPFIVIALAYPLLALARSRSTGRTAHVGPLALSGAALLCVLANPVVLSRVVFVLVPEKWEPIRVHRLSQELTRQAEEPKLVLTLGPLYAVEAGCDVYPELSSGSIVYRIADRMTPHERRITRTVGPATLAEMVKDRPPAAVIVGIELQRFAELEKPLRQAVPPDWPRQDADSLEVYVRP
ncbi:MAG TPA: hypothetical protein VLI39_02125 [Sedimentisphaerales bacterium]|nr:hypothetical protein [Sedimentisphaerales bacterium]